VIKWGGKPSKYEFALNSIFTQFGHLLGFSSMVVLSCGCRQRAEHCCIQLLRHHHYEGVECHDTSGARWRSGHRHLGRVARRWLAAVRLQVTCFHYLGQVYATPVGLVYFAL